MPTPGKYISVVSAFHKRKVCEIICKVMDLGYILAHSVFYLYAHELIFPARHYANTESLAGDGNSCWIFISLLHSWVQALLVPKLRSYFSPNFMVRDCVTHPSWMGRMTKVVTREMVYYILSGTPRGTQKYLWPNLRASFLGDIHPWRGHFSGGHYRPLIELQMVAMNSWRNSDVF